MRSATVYVPMPYGAEEIMTSVEASVQRGLPEFRIVGLPDRSVREAVVRVKSAILASGFSFPLGRVLVNIGPAHIKKVGTRFDLAIALAVLMAQARVATKRICIGELSLQGTILPCEQLGDYAEAWIANFYNPSGRGSVAASLKEAWEVAVSDKTSEHIQKTVVKQRLGTYAIDAIRGNDAAKRALLIALAGKHNVLLLGPPGSGKTMLAEAARELLPLPSPRLQQEIKIMHMQAGTRYAGDLAPYQQPMQRVTVNQLLGNPGTAVPGAFSLAHSGVLFLDELPYMRTEVLQALRQPMQSGVIRLGAHGDVVIPARPIVIAAQNLCGCGKLGMPGEECTCTPHQRVQYNKRLDAALLDRFALSVGMSYQDTAPNICGEQFSVIIARVHQQKMTIPWLSEAESALARFAETLRLSFRGRAQVKAVSETIASIDACDQVKLAHVQEAMQYRVRRV